MKNEGHFVILLEKFFIELKEFSRKINKEGQDRLEYLIQNKIIDESINQKYLINSKK